MADAGTNRGKQPAPHLLLGTRTGATARDEEAPDDLMACGLIDGMEMMHWLNAHPEWITIGEWSEERCAFPVYITDRGLDALANREQYDMEPVEGGLVEPGWKAIPLEQ